MILQNGKEEKNVNSLYKHNIVKLLYKLYNDFGESNCSQLAYFSGESKHLFSWWSLSSTFIEFIQHAVTDTCNKS